MPRGARTMILALLALGACSDATGAGSGSEATPVVPLSEEEWRALASRSVYFGHKSVGRNIVAGVDDLLAGSPSALRVVTGSPAALAAGPALVESDIGENGDPLGKTRAFAAALKEAPAGAGLIALHKYCYVDVTPESDVRRLFAEYRSAMTELRRAHPAVSFVHVTMPLTTAPEPSLKNSLKRLLGRADPDLNTKRNEFNRLLRAEYNGREPIFDLAAIESRGPDGRPVFYEEDGERIYSLAREWTYDGGHLNEAGRRVVARELLAFLASLPIPPTTTTAP